jgi:hypothetical protein
MKNDIKKAIDEMGAFYMGLNKSEKQVDKTSISSDRTHSSLNDQIPTTYSLTPFPSKLEPILELGKRYLCLDEESKERSFALLKKLHDSLVRYLLPVKPEFGSEGLKTENHS